MTGRLLLTAALVAACDPRADTDAFELDACPDKEACSGVADGASLVPVRACIPEGVERPWYAGEEGAPDLTMKLTLTGGTWRTNGEDEYTGTLDARQRCLEPELVTGTEEFVVVTGTFLGAVEEVVVGLTPAEVVTVRLSTSPGVFDASGAAQITVTANVEGPDGANVSDGTSVTFHAEPDLITVNATVTPETAYVEDGKATTTLVLLPGATYVTLSATATPPNWGDVTPASTTGTLTVYADPG